MNLRILQEFLAFFVGLKVENLVDYDSTNVFRVWVDQLKKVIRTRDVTFDSSTKYDPAEPSSIAMIMEETPDFIETIDLGMKPQVDLGIIDEIDHNLRSSDFGVNDEPAGADSAIPSNQKARSPSLTGFYPTPEATPAPKTPTPSPTY